MEAGGHGKLDESAIRRAWEAGDIAAATTAALRLYGADVYGFLAATNRGGQDADEVFSLLAERLWKSFSTFEWACSVRTWMYLLARHASADARRRAARAERRRASSTALEEVVAEIRTETRSFLKTENRSQLQKLRDELNEEEAMLLVLRVDRNLSWRDVAEVLSSAETPAEREKEIVRLRKRFQLVRKRLRERGKALGLVT